MRTQLPFAVLAVAFACTLATAPANARARVFVASYGNDANPCTFGSPCKTFQVAVNVVDPGGEVTAIDSAGFGPISITKAVTITSPAGVEAGIVPAAGGDGVDINAGASDAVVLRGLTMNGSSGGNNGIVFKSGASITIIDCVVQNFLFEGILLEPTSGANSFFITNTIVAHNGSVGIYYLPPSGSATATGVLDHVTSIYNIDGIDIVTTNGGGTTKVDITNSIASNNNGDGIFINNASAALTVSIDNTHASGNTVEGIFGGPTPTVLLGRSVITENATGVLNGTSPNTFYSYGDNRINANGTDVPTALSTTFKTQ